MVTFAAATKTTSTIPTSAPAQRRVDRFVAITCSDPNDSCDLYSDDCRSHAQLVSPSRDPIGYVDGPNYYQYVKGSCLSSVDPVGKQTLKLPQQDPPLGLPLPPPGLPGGGPAGPDSSISCDYGGAPLVYPLPPVPLVCGSYSFTYKVKNLTFVAFVGSCTGIKKEDLVTNLLPFVPDRFKPSASCSYSSKCKGDCEECKIVFTGFNSNNASVPIALPAVTGNPLNPVVHPACWVVYVLDYSYSSKWEAGVCIGKKK